MPWRPVVPFFVLLIGTWVCGSPAGVDAAPPKLTLLYPAGAARGQTTRITATGEWAPWPVRTWVDRPGVSVTCEADPGKLRVEVAADAQPGTYWMRLVNDEGASAPRPLVIGVLPEKEEVEPNDAPASAQRLEGAATINGKLAKAGDVDSFAIALRAGQTLVASVDAHTRLGSPMDAVLQVAQLVGFGEATTPADPLRRGVDAFVLEQRDDEVGLDPRLAFTAPRDGWYLVRVFAFPAEPNSSIAFAGGDTYVYRLTLTTGPFVDLCLPLAIARPHAGSLQLLGWNLPENLTRWPVAAPAAADAERAVDELDPVTISPAEAAGGLTVPWSDYPVVVAAADCSLSKPQVVPLPAAVSGLLATPRDHDAFQVSATKGQKIVARVDARGLGFPLDPLVQILDAAGKVLAEADDSNNQRDVELAWTAPDNGEYRVLVRDVHQHAGPRYAYRLTLAESQPDFALTVAVDSFVVTAGTPLEIPVTVDRRGGFNLPIEVRAEGLPGGVSVQAVTSAEKGDSAKSVKLIVQADAAALAAPVGQPIRIVGVAMSDKPLRRTATFSVTAPSSQHRWVWLTARK